jgi:glycosyltransferase involved in cell wall biosynthesis
MTEPGDVDGFSKAVVKLWSNQEAYSQMGKNARKLMEDKFDKKTQFNEFLKFFHKITEK